MNARFTVAVHIVGMIAWIARDLNRSAISRELAASAGTHQVYVRGLLVDLGKAGITVSQRGRGGGTVLARPADQITLADVYRAIRADDASLLGGHPGTTGPHCLAAPLIADYLADVYADAEAVLIESLSRHTVDKMSKAVVKGIRQRAVEATTH